MSKIIKVTDQQIDEIRKDFNAALEKADLSDGKINFTKTFGSITRKARVLFTSTAWMKMQALISEFNKEVAWHGIASRGEDGSKDEYYISDILVYPQEVTSATVNTDQEKYQMWLMSQDDNVFNSIRMQGHSHVSMGTTPSSVDISHQEKIVQQAGDDDFYIFMIWNKKNEKTIKIYDFAKNILFETSDITVDVINSDAIEAFLKDAKEMVKDKVYAPVQYKGYYGSYGSQYTGRWVGASSGVNNDEKKNTHPLESKENEKKSGKRKGKRSSKYYNGYMGASGGSTRQLDLYNYQDDDDYYCY